MYDALAASTANKKRLPGSSVTKPLIIETKEPTKKQSWKNTLAGMTMKYYNSAITFALMKNLIGLLFLLSIVLSGCEPKPERVIESEWNAEQPKLVAYFLEEGDVKFKQKEEKFYEDGTMEYSGGYDAEGNRHGEWKYFYKTGTLWSLGNYTNGLKTGKKEVYWPKGQIRYEGFFAEDAKSGHWIFYDMEDQIIDELDF